MLDLLYNVILLALDVAILRAVHSYRLASVIFGAAGMFIVAWLLAAGLAMEPFGAMRLLSYGVFVHGSLLAATLSRLVWRSSRPLAIATGAIAVVLVGI